MPTIARLDPLPVATIPHIVVLPGPVTMPRPVLIGRHVPLWTIAPPILTIRILAAGPPSTLLWPNLVALHIAGTVWSFQLTFNSSALTTTSARPHGRAGLLRRRRGVSLLWDPRPSISSLIILLSLTISCRICIHSIKVPRHHTSSQRCAKLKPPVAPDRCQKLRCHWNCTSATFSYTHPWRAKNGFDRKAQIWLLSTIIYNIYIYNIYMFCIVSACAFIIFHHWASNSQRPCCTLPETRNPNLQLQTKPSYIRIAIHLITVVKSWPFLTSAKMWR